MNAVFALSLVFASGKAAYPPHRDLSLVVIVTVDQLRPDYFARYGEEFTGGFRTILDRGTLFDHGQQSHAITETAPGHATILSGREPASTGIMDNDLGVEDPSAPLLAGGPGPGASPRRFRGTTLFDWLEAADSTTQVLSVSRKDRGAIMTVGRARAPIYWWSNGVFTTSRFYADSLPTWVQAFNAGRPAQRLAGKVWDLLLPASAYSEADDERYENGGKDVTFPHRLPGVTEIARHLEDYPWMDSLTLAFALEGARVLHLGGRRNPDLLLVSLSSTDAVGHRYGPDSREIHDQLLRVDRWLGQFLDSLAARVPPPRTLVVLTADHGVQSFPERVPGKGRVWLGDLAQKGWSFGSGLLSADTAALSARGVLVDRLARRLAAAASRRKGVARVFTPATLAAAPPT
ncbi:MAG: alkaline phosphatase family protein, partial [Gemmatimonadales bacterium]